MAEIFEKIHFYLPRTPNEPAHEKLRVSARFDDEIKEVDVLQVIGILAADLAEVQPPIEGPYRDRITLKIGRSFQTDQTHTVSATFVRIDAATTNSKELGYIIIGTPPMASPAR